MVLAVASYSQPRMAAIPGQDWFAPKTPSSDRFPALQTLQSSGGVHSWLRFVLPGKHLQLGATIVGRFGACHDLTSLPDG
jgi:hypothetical protein